MNETVSVIIPNYNRAALLEKAVRSVLEQTQPVLEILVCDDGSTDDARDRIAALQEKHPNIFWIDCGKNGRPSIPRNKGIERAKGTWIAFLDNDDTWLPEKIEKQWETALQDGCKFICSNAWKVYPETDEKKKLLNYNSGDYTFSDLIRDNFVVCSSVFLHRSLLEGKNKFPEERCFKAIEDYALWLHIALREKIRFIDSPLVCYLDMPGQSIRSEQENEYVMRGRILRYIRSKSLAAFHIPALFIILRETFVNAFRKERHTYRLRKIKKRTA